MSLLKFVMGIAVATALVACGGGGGSAGTTPGGTNDGAAVVSSFVFTLDKSSITNGGSDQALLTVTALDAGRNVMSDVAVSVSVDSGVYTPITSTTDSTGQVSGNISIGGNKANRNITATIRVGATQTGTAIVTVSGSQITLTPSPVSVSPGQSVLVTVKATDVNGVGMAGKVQLGGTLGFTQVVDVNPNGSGTATLPAAPISVGTYSVTATGFGVNTSRDVQVVGVGAGSGIPDAVGVISSASIGINPSLISPNLVGSTTNRANIRAVFQNLANQAIQNVRVRYEIVNPLGSGELLSTGNTTLYSDASGVVTADYIAGTRTSPTNGVIVRACYGLTDASLANGACPNSVSTTMTVAGQALSITLGDNNELQKGGNNLTYIKLFDVAVADSAGVAVRDAIVSASVDIFEYGKGPYVGPRIRCDNEDTNRNGFLDTGEDVDGNGVLSPRKADIIVSFTGSNITGSNGRTSIQVEYPQNVATWLRYTVRVTTNVAGSEGTVAKNYTTGFIIGDDTNGAFLLPPYGVNGCSTAN